MTQRRIGTRQEWAAARAELLTREKEYTRLGDVLAKQRRELPWVPVSKEYKFQTEQGPATLAELFDDCSQLVVYHFMFGAAYDAGCPACSATADGFNGVLTHLKARDVTMICVSRAPLEKLLAYRKRMGWTFNWASSHDSDFNFDFGVSAEAATYRRPDVSLLEANELNALRQLNEQPALRQTPSPVTLRNATTSGTDLDGYLSEGHGLSTFAREEGRVYHCYSSYGRGTDALMMYYTILDRVPNGRSEGADTMNWLRRHDEYEFGSRRA